MKQLIKTYSTIILLILIISCSHKMGKQKANVCIDGWAFLIEHDIGEIYRLTAYDVKCDCNCESLMMFEKHNND